MQPKALLALLGSVLAIVGVFAPFIVVGTFGSASLFDKDAVGGGIIVVAALGAAVAGYLGRWAWLWYTAGIVGGVSAMEALHIYLSAQGMKESLLVDGGLVGALGSALAGAIQLSWAAPMLVLGTLGIVAAALLRSSDEGRGVHQRGAKLAPLVGVLIFLGLMGVGAAMGQQARTEMVQKSKADAARKAAEEQARIKAEAAAEAEETQARQTALNQLEFTNFAFETGDYSGSITGKLTNNSERVIHDISLKFNLLDADKNVVGDATDYIDSLNPGQTWAVEAGSYEDSAVTAQFPEIRGRAYEYDWEKP